MRAMPWLLVVPLLLSSCAKLPKLPKSVDELLPQVAFADLKVSNVDWEGAKATFHVDVTNPHPIGLDIPAVNWDLDLAGGDFLEGVKDTPLKVDAGATSTVKIPVQLAWGDVLNVASGAKSQDDIPFALAGELTVDTPLGSVPVPFAHEGRLPVLHVPKVSLEGVRVDEVELLKNRAALAVDLALSSEQATALSVDDFVYTLKLSGTKVASGKASVPAVEGRTVVTLPIELSLLELGSELIDAITGKKTVKVGLDGAADLTTPLGVLPVDFSEATELKLR